MKLINIRATHNNIQSTRMKKLQIPPPRADTKKKPLQPPMPSKTISSIPNNQQPISIDEPEAQRPQKIAQSTIVVPQKGQNIADIPKSEQIAPTQNFDDNQFEEPKKQQKSEAKTNVFVPPKKSLVVPVRAPMGQMKKPGRPNPPPISKPSLNKQTLQQQNNVQLPQALPFEQPASQAKVQKQLTLPKQQPTKETVPSITVEQAGSKQAQQTKQPNSQANNEVDQIPPIENPQKAINIPNKAPKIQPNSKKGPSIPPKLIHKPNPPVKISPSLVQTQILEQKVQQKQDQVEIIAIKREAPKIETTPQIPSMQKVKIPSQPPKPSSPKNKKPQIEHLKIEGNKQTSKSASISPSVAKSSIQQRLQQFRLANQKMLADQSEYSEEEQGSGEDIEDEGPNQSQFAKPDFIKEDIPKQQQIVANMQQKISVQKKDAQKPQSSGVQQALPNKILPKPPAPAIKKIPPQIPKQTKQLEGVIPELRTQKTSEDILPSFQAKTLMNQQPKQHKQKALQQVKPQQQAIVKQQITDENVRVTLQAEAKQKSEVDRLLERYYGLKNHYLTNLRELDELIHFQKQQQQAQVQKINHLLSSLRSKNELLKQICSDKLQRPQPEAEEIAI